MSSISTVPADTTVLPGNATKSGPRLHAPCPWSLSIHVKLGHQCSVVFCRRSCDRISAGGVGDNYGEPEGIVLTEMLNCFDGIGSAVQEIKMPHFRAA